MSEINRKNEEATQTKRVEKPVANGKIKKKSEIRKFSEVFFAEDIGNVGNFVLSDVVVPAIKKVVSDIVREGIDMILYGSNGRSKKSSGVSYVSYNKMSDRRDGRSYDEPRSARYSYDDIVLDSRAEADEVLSQMEAIIDTYTMVSVADLYDLVGHTGNYTDHKYGWMNIRNAEVVRVRDGYQIKLPKALPLK